MHLFFIAALALGAVADLGATPPPQTSPGTLTGTVTDAVTGRPIGGALVATGPGGFAAMTDSSGRYQVTVPAATYSVGVSVQGRPSQTVFGVGVRSGTTTTLDFALAVAPSTGVLTGIVQNAGAAAEPLPNALVKLAPGNASATTNDAGAYAV